MSDEEKEHPIHKALNSMFGHPPSPEDRVAVCKLRQAEARSAIPHGEDLLLKLREFEALTHNHTKLGPVRAVMAGILEDLRFDADHLDPDHLRWGRGLLRNP